MEMFIQAYGTARADNGSELSFWIFIISLRLLRQQHSVASRESGCMWARSNSGSLRTKNRFHVNISGKKNGMGFWCDIQSLLNRPYHAMHAYNFGGSCLTICRNFEHVSTTLTNELQCLLPWKDDQRIGNTKTTSRKQNGLRTHVFLETCFTVSGKLMHSCSSSHQETCKSNDTWLQE